MFIESPTALAAKNETPYSKADKPCVLIKIFMFGLISDPFCRFCFLFLFEAIKKTSSYSFAKEYEEAVLIITENLFVFLFAL